MFELPSTNPLGLRVCVIGGGGTGAALAWDLSLRGFAVTLLEKGELTSGTTGRHHGQLHSGARYAMGDRAIARECMEETLILRRIVPEAIEYNGGLFVSVGDDDPGYGEAFLDACADSLIPAREIPVTLALAAEPSLSPGLKRAVWVPDGSLDAFRLPLSFFAGARLLGASIRPYSELVGFDRRGPALTSARFRDLASGKEARVDADYFVNACGAWAGLTGALAGVDIPVTPAAGSMLAVRGRLCNHVISRLRPPGDGDILVPQRGLSIIGSTQWKTDSPEGLLPPEGDIRALLELGGEMVPALADAPVYACWTAARPLAGKSTDDGRTISRDFSVRSHADLDGLRGFASVTGGKATTLRAMAERTADLVCRELGVESACRTRDTVLPSWRAFYRGVSA